MNRFRLVSILCVVATAAVSSLPSAHAADGSKYAHSDGNARYRHQIALYDANNRRITAESDTPYSTQNTCGRCHDYETISHGWHFNAFDPDAVAGRRAEPWIWTDVKTGTQLPLSYRDWEHTFRPDEIGITPWQMTLHFGGRIPGGGMGHAPSPDDDSADEPATSEDETQSETANRWAFSGSLEIDCMVCHAVAGSYDFNSRREQIEEENFAWAATVGVGLGQVSGKASSIKDGSDPEEEATQAKLPKVTYDSGQFATDGTVHMDLIRKPSNNACYQCHSFRSVDENGITPRWNHDQDVHLQSGMDCVDCHRNGIDHHISRGFPGEEHPSGQSTVTLSCAGCHLGAKAAASDLEATAIDEMIADRGGRLGSPQPLHEGLPPVHFEKLSCTACHGGPIPRDEALGMMTSLAHHLGSKGHRTGQELPLISAPVYLKANNGKITPHRSVWPAFWGVERASGIDPIAPDKVAELTRKALRVRKDFVAELLQPKLSSSDMKQILGEERARTKDDEWTEQEAAKVKAAVDAAGKKEFEEKVSAALETIEEELGVEKAVYVSGGFIYSRGTSSDTLVRSEQKGLKATEMVSWPMAHNVRPAGWSLGVAGCTECHSDDAPIFASTVRPRGPGPDFGPKVSMASLQGIDADQRLAWNQLFGGRKSFKFIVAGSIIVLLGLLFFGSGLLVARRRHVA